MQHSFANRAYCLGFLIELHAVLFADTLGTPHLDANRPKRQTSLILFTNDSRCFGYGRYTHRFELPERKFWHWLIGFAATAGASAEVQVASRIFTPAGGSRLPAPGS
jgi:hypothetical protein